MKKIAEIDALEALRQEADPGSHLASCPASWTGQWENGLWYYDECTCAMALCREAEQELGNDHHRKLESAIRGRIDDYLSGRGCSEPRE